MIMKIIGLVLVSSLVVVSIDAQVYANGTILRDDKLFTCSGTGPQCAEDCVHLLLCAAGQTYPFESIDCAASSPLTPYCGGNRCSKSPVDCTSSSTFRCTDEGFFPDPNNCTRYRICDGSNPYDDGNTYECPKGFLFNAKINICELGKLSRHTKICNTIDCSQKRNEVVVYRSNPTYFAFCFVDSDNGRRETLMFKCDSDDEIYDLAENTCKYNCKGAGHFQDPTNCTFYYVCSAASFGTYRVERIQCPPNYYFDGERCTTDTSNCSPEALEGAASK